jgi:hypothetical protein
MFIAQRLAEQNGRRSHGDGGLIFASKRVTVEGLRRLLFRLFRLVSLLSAACQIITLEILRHARAFCEVIICRQIGQASVPFFDGELIGSGVRFIFLGTL